MADLTALTDLTAIQDTLYYVYNLDTGSSTVTTVAAQKTARLALYLQESIVRFWMSTEFPWTMRTKALAAISATGQGVLPANFLEVTGSGGLCDTSDGKVFESKDIQYMTRLNQQTNLTSKSHIYAIGFSKEEDDERYLYVPKPWSGTTTLSLTYKKVPPGVDIGVTPKPALTEIPVVYHYNYFLPYLRFRGYEDCGDPRAGIWLQMAQDGLKDALRAERIGIQKDTVQRIVGAGLARTHY
jgi:hypothetical protein